MPTIPLYMNDAKMLKTDAVVTAVGRDDKGDWLVLDATVFHPQGGGQPADRGLLVIGASSHAVTHVAWAGEAIRHYVSGIEAVEELPGVKVHAEIDSLWRLENARNHSAGHLLAACATELAPKLQATKAFHFKEGPYVEFEADQETIAQITGSLPGLEAAINDEIQSGKAVTARIVTSTAASVKPQRCVTIEGFHPVPCGGTHVGTLSEIGVVRVLKAKTKGNTIKISYRVECPS